ncbi:hypothetical protein Hanom_Chr05g00450221 [Helianthus anomalus]
MKQRFVIFGDSKMDQIWFFIQNTFSGLPISFECCFIKWNTNHDVLFSTSFN